MTIERRTFSTKVELRVDANGGRTISGHSPVWNRYSQNLGGFVEQIHPDAANQAIVENDIRGLFNHDPSLILGRNRNPLGGEPTMRLVKDNVGLLFEIDIPDTTVGRDLAVSMERGDIDGASFSFRAIEDEWSLTDDDFPLRTITRMKMYDTGPVTFPAYLDSDAGVRSEQRSVVFGGLVKMTGYCIEEIEEAAAANELRTLMTAKEQIEESLRETRQSSFDAWLERSHLELRGRANG